jgi:pimeloyl-ACP methyl ester carboxylesterase
MTIAPDIQNSERRRVLGTGLVALAAAGLAGAAATAPSEAAAASRTGVSHDTAPNRFIEAGGVRFAYRRFGTGQGVPILLLQHFIGTMDWWDPLLTDGLARTRPVILLDNRGVGISSDRTPDTVEAMAADVAAFVDALGLKRVDVLGFSIGGMVAQELVLARPDLVRRLILAGTGPRGGENMQETPPDVVKAVSVPDPGTARPYLFFSPSAQSQAAAARFLKRTAQRKVDLDPRASIQTMQAQGQALHAWGVAGSRAAFAERLGAVKQPVLVVNGNNDIMVPTINSYLLFQAIPNAELILYPDSGHGAIFQYAGLFVEQANLFLNRNDQGLS